MKFSIALLILASCTPAAVEAGAHVAGHAAALTDCRAIGKDAGSYAVYTDCADDADRRYGLDGGP